jgi:hypothetical protein
MFPSVVLVGLLFGQAVTTPAQGPAADADLIESQFV